MCHLNESSSISRILKLNVETFFLKVSVVTTYSATVFMQLESFDFIVNVEYIEYSKI